MENESFVGTDIITALGHLCLGSRLKRLGERMQSGVAPVLAELGHRVQPAQLPILMALQQEGAMTIGLLGQRVGISQPGVSRAIAALEIEGLVRASPAGRDRRQRSIELSTAGAAMMDQLRARLFPAVERAVGQLCADASAAFLGEIDDIEHGLGREPLDQRIRRELAAGDA